MPFKFTGLELAGIVMIEPRRLVDARGAFVETYKQSDFAANGIDVVFAQDNHSFSSRGVLRGLHYQLPPFDQAKLIRCLRGRIYDVVVDIRRSSPNFGRWIGIWLDAASGGILFIPAGFAHGFQAVDDQVEIVYKVSSEYDKDSERGIAWDDPDLAVDWPISPPVLSPKDEQYPALRRAEVFP